MKKGIPFFVAITVAAVITAVLFLFAPVGYARAEEVVQSRSLIGRYYEFGALSQITTDGEDIYAFEVREGALYLRVLGQNEALFLLKEKNEFNEEDLSAYALAAVDGKAYMYLGGETLAEYDATEKTVAPSVFPSRNNPGGLFTYELSALCADTQNKVLLINYANYVYGYDLQKANLGLEESNVFSIFVTDSYDRMLVKRSVAGEVTLFFYNTVDGYVYAVKHNYADDLTAKEVVTARLQTLYASGEHGALYAPFENGAEYAVIEDTPCVAIRTATGPRFLHMGAGADEKLQSVDDMCAANGYLYVVDNAQKAVKIYRMQEREVALCGMYGSFGYGEGSNAKGLTRLLSPALLSGAKEGVAVYDGGNRRIVTMVKGVTVCAKETEEEVCALALCYDAQSAGYVVWYAEGRYVYAYSVLLPQEVRSFQIENPVSYIGWDGVTLYVLAGDKKFNYKGGEFVLAEEELSNAVVDRAGMHGGVRYQEREGVLTMFKDGVAIVSCTPDQAYEEWASDYKGNLWLLSQDTVYAYMREDGEFRKVEYRLDTILSHLTVTAEGNCYALAGDTVLAVALPVATLYDETDFGGEKYTQDYKMLRLNETVWAYSAPDNYESILRVAEGTVSVIFEKIRFLDADYYGAEVLRDGSYLRIYLHAEAVSLLNAQDSQTEKIKYAGVDHTPKGYAYPSKSAQAVADIPKGQALEVVCEVGEPQDVWFAVRVPTAEGEVVCYVQKNNNYVPAVEPYKTVERYYAKISLKQLGASVPVYAEANVNSKVLTYLTEGAKVEMPSPLDENDAFTRIRYGEGYAYIQTAYLQEEGLTRGQTIAIVFGCVSFVLALVPLALYAIKKRRRE